MAWAAFTISFVDRLAWGNVQLRVGHELGLPLASLGVFVSAFYAGYVFSNAVTGYATDVFGPRVVLSASAMVLGLATMAFGLTGSVATGMAFQAVMGLSAGADYAACLKLLTTWFEPKERGRAIGLWFTGSSIAVVLTNAWVPPLEAKLGWQGAYHVLGAVTMLIALVCWIVLRDGPASAAAPPRPDLRALFRNRELLLVSVAGFGALWGTWGFVYWANPLMVRGHGMAVGHAAAIAALFGLGAAIAKPLIGWMSDSMGGARKPLALCCLVAFAALLFIFGALQNLAALRIVAPILGVAAFAYSPLLAAMVTELAGRGSAGSASGATNAMWQLGLIVVPLVVGLVYQETKSFPAACAALAAGPLLGAVALSMVREPRPE